MAPFETLTALGGSPPVKRTRVGVAEGLPMVEFPTQVEFAGVVVGEETLVELALVTTAVDDCEVGVGVESVTIFGVDVDPGARWQADPHVLLSASSTQPSQVGNEDSSTLQ